MIRSIPRFNFMYTVDSFEKKERILFYVVIIYFNINKPLRSTSSSALLSPCIIYLKITSVSFI